MTATYNGRELVDVGEAPAVEVASNLVGFGGLHAVELHPRVQIDAVYGLLDTDHEALTASGGTAVASNGQFVCTTGTTVGAYAVIRSRRLCRYRAGQAVRLMFTARFTAGVASSLQLAGGFNATEFIGLGYNGTEFGAIRRQAGAVAIHRLTVTTGTGGAETLTVTLNGVAFNVSAGGVLTAEGVASLLASQTYAGWSIGRPQSVGATVTWLQDVPAATAGAFTLSSSGTAAGTFATIQAGAANVITGDNVWMPQTSWNVDKLDGTGPSGMTLDPTKLNAFVVIVPYLGAGTIVYAIMTPSGEMQPVHRLRWPNSSSAATMRNPTLRLGWIAASLGSSSSLTIAGASSSAFREGPSQPSLRHPRSAARTGMTVTTTETTALTMRVRSELGATVNLRELLPTTVSASNETSARNVIARIYINPTLSGTPSWSRSSGESAVDVSTTALTVASGSPFETRVLAGAGHIDIGMHEYDVRLEPGGIMAITLATTTSTATVDVSSTWLEI
jgi:hypothetical protein